MLALSIFKYQNFPCALPRTESFQTLRSGYLQAVSSSVVFRVLITGGAGFIGSSLAGAFLFSRKNYHVTVLDNLTRGHLKNISKWLGSLDSTSNPHDQKASPLQKIVDNSDIIFHLACKSRRCDRNNLNDKNSDLTQYYVFNIGSNDTITVMQIAKIVIDQLSLKNGNVKIEVKNSFKDGRGWKGDIPDFWLDCSS